MKAVLSVYDKEGIVDFGRALRDAGFDLVSTGKTHEAVSENGASPVSQVSDLTGFPEMLDGRVKTLHPNVYAGILARRDLPNHMAQLSEHGIDTIDLVAVNLYPFVDTVNKPDVLIEDALENIDIGGPSMIRAAAKNFVNVIVVVDPSDYEWIGNKLQSGNTSSITLDERKTLARKAFQHVAFYDTAITQYLGDGNALSSDELTLGYNKVYDLRYGENPHQKGSIYSAALCSGGIVSAERLYGEELSFTNVLDADAAWIAVSDFSQPAAVVVKHTNPCGFALDSDQPIAYKKAFEGDTVSAYGGIVGFNTPVTEATAQAMKGTLYHIVVAPGYDDGALEILKNRKQVRLLKVTAEAGPLSNLEVRKVSGGVLLQTLDTIDEDSSTWDLVTDRKPTHSELDDLAFAWKVSKHIKSNAIVLAKGNAVVGMGAGQPNRVTSVHLALRIAGDKAKGSVLASDAFFPFADSIQMAVEGGIDVISQPGGSVRDDEVIAEANRLNVAMVFTGIRHFKH